MAGLLGEISGYLEKTRKAIPEPRAFCNWRARADGCDGYRIDSRPKSGFRALTRQFVKEREDIGSWLLGLAGDFCSSPDSCVLLCFFRWTWHLWWWTTHWLSESLLTLEAIVCSVHKPDVIPEEMVVFYYIQNVKLDGSLSQRKREAIDKVGPG